VTNHLVSEWVSFAGDDWLGAVDGRLLDEDLLLVDGADSVATGTGLLLDALLILSSNIPRSLSFS